MKKLIFSAAVLASAFFAASCQQEMLDPQAEGTTVTYTVEVPGALATKSANGFELIYEVYRENNTLIYESAEPIPFGQNGKVELSLEFVKDQNFTVLFWAQKEGAAYNTGDLRNVTLGTLTANQENYEVFAGKDDVTSCVSSSNGNVVLVRPVAQLNIATLTSGLTLGNTVSSSTNTVSSSTVMPEFSDLKVTGLYSAYNVATGEVIGDAGEVSYVKSAIKANDIFNSDYTRVGMNYVGFMPEEGANVEVDFNIYTKNDGDISHKVSNVPVKANYKTNIIGNLISATADYHVTLEEWADAGKDMVVLADGIVKNINGDYEISTAVGFAYAINKLFADGGTFYIHPGSYNFAGLVVVPQPTKPGVILNVKANEKPVVTRSTTGFEIIGLDVAYLVSEVTNGSQAIFSNLVLPEDTKLVGTNNGVVGVSGCSNEDTDVPAELIGVNGQNGKVVNTVSMASVKDINDAIAQDLKLIELTGDITGLTEIFTISKSVTIDGCGHKLTSSAGRAINVSGADGVTIKNLVINCSGERAINIIQNADNVTIDNVTATAANYTVNVAPSAPGAVVNIENSTLNGLCTVNVASPGAVVTVDNSTINCNDTNTTEGEAYAAIGLNKDAVRGQIIVRNSTINVTEGSDSVKARNGAEDGSITIDGSEEEVTVQVAAITFEDSDYYYSFTSLEDAIASAQKYNRPVTLIRDLNVAETITIEEGQTVVLDLNGKTLAAADMNVIKNNGGNLTIKNGTVTRTGDVVGYSVNNASGEIVIDNATIQRGLYTSGSKMTATNANISHEQSSRHAIYAWNCEVTIHSGTFHNDNAGNATLMASGSSVVTINGGTFSIADGHSSLGWTSSMIDQNSTAQVLVKGGLFNGGFRINSADTKLTIEDGEFNTNNGSGFTDYSGTKVVKGGKFTDEGAQNWAKKYIAEGFKMNADGEVVEKDYVAQVGDKKYESLQEAFNAGGEITLLCDVTISETATLADGKTAVLDLNGKTITGTMHKSVGAVVENNGTLTIQNGTISSTAANGGSAVMNNGTLTFKGATLNGAPNADNSWPSYTVNNTAVMTATNTKFTSYHGSVSSYGDGAVVTLNNSEIDMAGIPGFTSHGIYTYSDGKVVVNGGTYANKATDQVASGASVINGAVEVNAGTFTGRIENYYGTPVLKGGTYSVNPTRFVATGYKTQQDGEVWNVVQE